MYPGSTVQDFSIPGGERCFHFFFANLVPDNMSAGDLDNEIEPENTG